MKTTGVAEQGTARCIQHGPGRLSGVFFRPEAGDYLPPSYVCARCWEEAGEPPRLIPEHFTALTLKTRPAGVELAEKKAEYLDRQLWQFISLDEWLEGPRQG